MVGWAGGSASQAAKTAKPVSHAPKGTFPAQSCQATKSQTENPTQKKTSKVSQVKDPVQTKILRETQSEISQQMIQTGAKDAKQKNPSKPTKQSQSPDPS